jgi:hypothetical protein
VYSIQYTVGVYNSVVYIYFDKEYTLAVFQALECAICTIGLRKVSFVTGNMDDRKTVQLECQFSTLISQLSSMYSTVHKDNLLSSLLI